jgi:hypothetical protein
VIDDRPRFHAERISAKVTELIREELKLVPKEFHGQVADLTLNGLCVDWELRKFKAKAGRRG